MNIHSAVVPTNLFQESFQGEKEEAKKRKKEKKDIEKQRK
jgi:hypothetical protein